MHTNKGPLITWYTLIPALKFTLSLSAFKVKPIFLSLASSG